VDSHVDHPAYMEPSVSQYNDSDRIGGHKMAGTYDPTHKVLEALARSVAPVKLVDPLRIERRSRALRERHLAI
jgi:hypothetical protein